MSKPSEERSGSLGPDDRAFLESIGQRIRVARTDRALTQKALGELAGVHDVHISRLESGALDTRMSTLRKIADALEMPLHDLLRP